MAKKIPLSSGDVFHIPLKDGSFVVGQVLEISDIGFISCAFFDIRLLEQDLETKEDLNPDKLISLASITPEQFKNKAWKIAYNLPISIARSMWPNERTRKSGWIGAKVYDSLIVEKFLNAFYSLDIWDPYKDPNYFDRLLVLESKKPNHLLFKGK